MAAYLLCILVPIGLKLAGLLAGGWWLATVALWAPAAFSLAYALVSLLVAPFFRRP